MKNIPAKGTIFLFTLLFLAIFFPVLFQNCQFGFRDDAHFYFPLFEYIQSYWSNGEVPLWDPAENLGTPLAANPTSSVFYPIKLLFFLPVDYQILYILYIIIHLPLAAGGMYVLMRSWKYTSGAAALTAFAYTFCGPVLFQYSNLIFLIGAAWLPWGIYFGDRLIRTRSFVALPALAFVLAMTLLGGEPQSGFFIGLILLLLCFFYRKFGLLPTRIQSQEGAEQNREQVFSRNRPIVKLMLAAALALAFSAVQLFPTLEFVRVSDRASVPNPQSIWQIPGFIKKSIERTNCPTNRFENEFEKSFSQNEKVFQDSQKSIVYRMTRGILCRDFYLQDQISTAYQFSVPPAHFLGMLWPNFCGKLFPYNSRWCLGAPDDRFWTPSLYIGIIPLILALSVMKFRTGRKNRIKNPKLSLKCKTSKECGHIQFESDRTEITTSPELRISRSASLHSVLRIWASWLALICLLGALGGYGPYWLYRACSDLFGLSNENLAVSDFDPVGGIYWLFQTTIPLFSQFRYPAKLLTPACFALAVLAGIGWDLAKRNGVIVPIVRGLLALSLLGIGLFLVAGADLFHLDVQGNQRFFGKYLPELAWETVMTALIQTALTVTLFYTFVFSKIKEKMLRRFSSLSRKQWIAGIVLTLTTLDLYLSNSTLLSTVPRSVFRVRSTCRNIMESTFRQKEDRRNDPSMIRIYRIPGWHPEFLMNRAVPTRMAERILWDRVTLAPRYQYMENMGIVNASGTMQFGEFSRMDRKIGEFMQTNSDFTTLFRFLDISFLLGGPDLLTGAPDYWQTEVIEKTDYQLDSRERVRRRFPIDTSINFMKNAGGRLCIVRDSDIYQTEQNVISYAFKKRKSDLLPGEFAKMRQYERQKIIFELSLKASGSVLIIEQYDKNWRTTVKNEKGEIFSVPTRQALGLLRAIDLPAGHFTVTMEYKPFSIRYGAYVSIISILTVFLFYFGGRKRTKDQSRFSFSQETTSKRST